MKTEVIIKMTKQVDENQLEMARELMNSPNLLKGAREEYRKNVSNIFQIDKENVEVEINVLEVEG